MAPRQRENPVEHVGSFFKGLCVGKCVAVLIFSWKKEPVTGVTKELLEDEFKIYYSKGTYFGKDKPTGRF